MKATAAEPLNGRMEEMGAAHVPANPRLILAADILRGWSLGEISEHGGSGSTLSVVNLALDLAERLYDGAKQRGWYAD